MKRALLFLILFLAPAAAAVAQAPDSCIVTGFLYGNDLSIAEDEDVYVTKSVTSDGITTLSRKRFSSDATGYIRMKVWRNSTIWVQGENVRGFDPDNYDDQYGVRLTIPDAATATLASLIPAESVPASYLIAVPNMYVLGAGGAAFQADSLEFSPAFILNDGVFPLRVELNPDSLGQVAYGDSIYRAMIAALLAQDIAGGAPSADSVATVLDSIRTAAIAALEADALAIRNLIGGRGDSDSLSAAWDSLGVFTARIWNAIPGAIADAGKWEQAGSVISPKAGITDVTVPGDFTTPGTIQAMAFRLAASGNRLYTSAGTNDYIDRTSWNSSSGTAMAINRTSNALFSIKGSGGRVDVTVSQAGKLNIGSTTHNANRLYVAGNVEVNPDSAINANNFFYTDGTSTTERLNFLPTDATTGWKGAAYHKYGEFRYGARFEIYSASKGKGMPWMYFDTDNYKLKWLSTSGDKFTVSNDSVTIYKPATILDHLTLFNAPNTDETRLKLGVGYLSAESGLTFYGPSHTYSTLRRHMIVTSGWGDLGLASGNLRGIAMYVGNGGSLTDNLTRRKLYMDSNGKTRIGDNGVAANALEVAGNVKIDSGLIVKGAVKTPRLHWDTLGVQQGDTLEYYVTGVEDPITIAGTGVKQGSVTFKMSASVAQAVLPYFVAIRGDSVNGVKPVQISGRSVGGRPSPAYCGELVYQLTQSGSTWYRIIPSGWYNSTKVPRLNVMAGLEGVGTYYVGFSVTGVNDEWSDAYGTMELKVEFQMPSDNTSEWYLDLAEW